MALQILVVDDDETVLKVLSWLLLELGHEVKTAPGPDEARALVRRERFNVAFIDNRLGQVDGIELIKELAELDPELYFILMSGAPDIVAAEIALGKGVCGFLRKPFRVEDVLVSISQADWRRKLDQQLKK